MTAAMKQIPASEHLKSDYETAIAAYKLPDLPEIRTAFAAGAMASLVTADVYAQDRRMWPVGAGTVQAAITAYTTAASEMVVATESRGRIPAKKTK